jgi:membrane protein DedA with SNARE-associated domain
METGMENRDSKLARNIIILIVAVVLCLFVFRAHILAIFQNQFLYTISPCFDLMWFQILNLVGCLLIYAFFTAIGYIKAKQKKLNPVRWAIICLFFSIWGYIFLLYYKGAEKKEA